MDGKKGLLFISLPMVAGMMLLAVMALRNRPEKVEAVPRRTAAAAPGSQSPPVPVTPRYTREDLLRPAPADIVASAAEETRLRGTYDNFRTAVATGNVAAQNSLEKVLRRNPQAAIRFAEGELANARTDSDRSIALRTLEALRR
jgi:hypothetical protein